MRYCRNKKLDKEIRELQISIDYWTPYLNSSMYENREHAKETIRLKEIKIRRLERMKEKQ